MNSILKTTASFGILLAALLAGPAAFMQTAGAATGIAWASPATVSQSTISSTAGSPDLTVPATIWAVGDEIYFNGTTAGSNPFNTTATRYYVISTNLSTIRVATTFNGTALNAVNTISGAATAQQFPDWLKGANWTGGIAPNDSNTIASFPGAGGGSTPPGGLVINGNVTIYGLGWVNLSQDLAITSGSSNGASLYPLTFATSDSTMPKITTTNASGGVIFFGSATANAAALKINGAQGLIFNAGAGGAISGSGTAATSTAPAKNFRLISGLDWSGFTGSVGIQIERGEVQENNNANLLPTNQNLTVGNAQTTLNSLLAGLDMNGRDCTIDGLNGTTLGRVYNNAAAGGILKIGNSNGSGTYPGCIGKNFVGTSTGPIFLQKLGSGTQILSGPITNVTTSVTVNAGTLILTAANGYGGVTTVNAGKLVISSAQVTTNTITVANGATLDVAVSGTSQLQPRTLTLGSTAAITLELINLASTTTAPLKPGTVTLNGTVTVNINSGMLSSGSSYPLVTWTTTNGAGSFVLGTVPLAGNLSIVGNTLFLNVMAPTNTWTGAGNGNWDTNTTNWTAGGVAGTYSDGSVSVFDDTATGATNVTVAQLVRPGIVSFNNSSLNYSVASSAGNYIGGAGNLNISGPGTVTLSGPNTYSGGTVLSAGQLNINDGGSNPTNSAIGTGTFTIGGGTIDNTGPGDVTLAPAIAQNWNGDFAYAGSVHNLNLGNGAVTLGTNRLVTVTTNTLTVGGALGDGGLGYSLTKIGNGTLALAGANTFSGGTIISNGTVQAGSSTALGSGPSQLSGGTLDLNGFSLVNSNNINTSVFTLTNSSASAGALVGNSTVNSSFTIGVGPGNISVARLIDLGAPLTVTKTGNGTLTFNGAGHNNLMGVIVNAGTAVFANVGGLSADRGVTLNSGTIKLNAVGAGSGINADLINNTQPFTINGGTFDLNGFNETVSTIAGTGGVILNNGTSRTLTIGPDNGGTAFSANYSGTIQNGTGVLALTKVGSGTQTLSGLNTYTGGTIITNTGTLQAGTNNVFPTAGGDMTVVSGTLDLNTFDNAINGLNGAGTVDTVAGGAPTLTVGANGNSGNFSGTLQNSAGTLSLAKTGAGVQTLSGANNYGGSTTISNGTLVIGSSLNGAGAVTVYGPGVLDASNSPAIAGAVTLAGTNATLSLLDGAIGTLSLNGGLMLTSSNVLKFDISSAGLDQIIVNGAFTQSGKATINVNAVNGPNSGTYTLISNGSGISTNNFVLGNSLSGYALSLASDGSNLYLVVGLNAPATAYWHNITGTTWIGHTGINYNWNTDQSSGINANAFPAASSDVFFAADGANNFNTTLAADFILKTLNFNVASNVTITGTTNTLTLNGAITVNSGAGSNLINTAGLVLGTDQNISVADAGNTLTISSPISGAHAFNVSGSGTVALAGASSFTAGTTISSGTLALNNPTNTLPDAGVVNVNGGTLSIGTNSDTVGAVTLASGNITGSSGVLKGSSYNVQNGTVSANLGGSGAMTMTGSSVLLASNSTYSGGTTISSGTLQLGASNALGSGSATITAGTTLDLNGQTIANVINYTGAGTATLVNNGASAAAVTTDANVASTVTVDTTGGNITLARMVSTSVPRTLTKTGPDTLTFNGAGHNNLIKLVVQGGTVVCANNGGFSADRGFELDFGTVMLAGPGSGGVYPNANLFNDGQQFYVLGGIFDLNGWNETVATLIGSVGVVENNATGTNSTLSLGADNGTGEFSGIMQDANGVLSIAKTGSGIQTLSGTSTYSGNTTINNGQLLVSASAASPNSTYVVSTNGGLQFHNDTSFLIGGLSGGGSVGLVNDGSGPISLAVGANNASTTYSGVLSDGGAGATLTKVGTGTLTLSGANTYAGLTTVSNGVLVISPNYAANGNFTVNEGAVFGVSANTPATSAQVGTLTLGLSGSGSSSILFTSLPNPTNAPVTVNALSPMGGAGSVIISNTAALAVGTYNLINYTTLTGAGFSAFALAPLPPGVAAHLANNTTAVPNQIQLVVTAINPQVWSGAVNTNWDINTTANWTLNGAATNYFDAGLVLFDDTVGGGQTTVSLAANVQPSSVTVSNNAKDYTFTTSTGKGINGLTGLTKNGTGTLTLINLTNNFTGGATINAGAVVLSSSTLGSGGITDNGNLVFSNGTTPVSVVISGSGTLTQNGTNTLELSSANNTYSGGTIIRSGTIQSDNPNSLGTGAVTLGDGASANNATLQAAPGSSFTNANPITVAAGGGGVYVIQAISGLDYNLSGNVTLNNALTIRTTSNGALFMRGTITSGGSNPLLTIDGGGTTTKFVQLTANNSSTFTGNVIVTNSGDFKLGLANALSSANTIALDSTSIFDNGSFNQIIAGLNNLGAGGGTVADAGGAGVFLTLGGGGSYSFSGVINNSGSIIKTGSGQQTLAGANTYTGVTVVSNGTLVINGSLAGGAVTVAGGTLAGSGVLNGATTVQSGGTLSPGVSGIGTLSISNALALQSGGTLAMDINKTAGTQDQIAGLTAVTYGGTLAVNNLAGSLTTSDAFKLFSAGSYAGAFAGISPATPGAGLLWNTNTLTTDGTLRIIASAAKQPVITQFSISGTNLTVQGTNGSAGGQYVLLSSTNIALPLSQWTPVVTNTFDGSGNFNLTTNFNATLSPQFFILSQ